jgi:hypothetical protein
MGSQAYYEAALRPRGCGRDLRIVLGTLALIFGGVASARAPVYIAKTDLQSLIRAAASAPVRFAVHVPHKVSAGPNRNAAHVMS